MGDDELGYGKMLTTGTQQHNIPHIRLGATCLPMVVSDIRLVLNQSISIELCRVVRKLTINGHVASCPHTCVVTISLIHCSLEGGEDLGADRILVTNFTIAF